MIVAETKRLTIVGIELGSINGEGVWVPSECVGLDVCVDKFDGEFYWIYDDGSRGYGGHVSWRGPNDYRVCDVWSSLERTLPFEQAKRVVSKMLLDLPVLVLRRYEDMGGWWSGSSNRFMTVIPVNRK